MGASQSSSGGNAAAPQEKTSYYELLGVTRQATDEEIKKAYRRKALELHPDRNFGNTEEATRLFAEVQVAYEVLSDSQERAWYDSHESAILRGADPSEDHYEHDVRVTTADDIAGMMSKFSSRIEFSDSPSGFYGYLREVFATLAKEEEHAAGWEGGDVPDYPSFGHKDDTYEDVVKHFYTVWAGFSTRKIFAWRDKYRLSEAPDRRYRRLMEKENKKLRDEGIREFNDAVRALVAFVRRRDPRYTPNTQTEEERQKALREAAAAQRARDKAANEAKMRDYVVPEWATARDAEDLEESEEEEEEEVEEVHFECVACRKTFKSEKQYDAHEKSKKHQKAVQALRRKMQRDHKNLNLDEDYTGSGVLTPVSPEGGAVDGEDAMLESDVDEIGERLQEAQVKDDSDEDQEAGQQEEGPSRTRPGGDTSKSPPSLSPSEEDAEEESDYAARSKVEARLNGVELAASAALEDPLSPSASTEEPSESVPLRKKGKAAQKRAKRAAQQATAEQSDLKFKCATCNAAFSSKTRMFQHIKDFNHAAPVSQVKKSGAKGKRR